MGRVTLVRSPGDHPSTDETTQRNVAGLFAALFAGAPAAAFDEGRGALAVLA